MGGGKFPDTHALSLINASSSDVTTALYTILSTSVTTGAPVLSVPAVHSGIKILFHTFFFNTSDGYTLSPCIARRTDASFLCVPRRAFIAFSARRTAQTQTHPANFAACPANFKIRLANFAARLANFATCLANFAACPANFATRLANFAARPAKLAARLANFATRLAKLTARPANPVMRLFNVSPCIAGVANQPYTFTDIYINNNHKIIDL
jgi:hypothetical protein